MMNQRRWSRVEEDKIIRFVRLCQDIRQLKQIHGHLVVKGQSQNNFLMTKLVRSLASLGCLEQARSLFDSVNSPGLFLWNAMIRGYSQTQDVWLCREAMILYVQMHRFCLNVDDVAPLTFTLSAVLKACAHVSEFELLELGLMYGMQIHAHVTKYRLRYETNIRTALIHFYSKCKRVEEMQQLFDRTPESQRDVQTWNTIIAGHAKNGDMEAALALFQEMPERNIHTWVEMIGGYATSGQMDRAQELFDNLKEPDVNGHYGSQSVSAVICTAMITGYSKCGDIASARFLFDRMYERDVASWNAMIAGYSHAGMYDEALDLFHLMVKSPKLAGQMVQPNHTTMATVISACAQLGSADLAQWIEDYLGYRCDLVNKHTSTALIEMHSKCGNLDKAYKVFQGWKARDVVCYSAMIEGFGIHGRGTDALHVFSQLLDEGLKPDGICFIAVLSACSHSGLVEEGCNYFKLMREDFNILPTADHYMCMVDLIGRAGHIDEAYKLITDVMPPLKPHAGVWGALLSASRIHSNVLLGELAAQHLLDLEPNNSGNYVLLANIYANARRWDDVGKVRALMKKFAAKKLPGCSWIQLGIRSRKFFTADVEDQQLKGTLELLNLELTDQGYLPGRDDDLE